MDIGWDSLFAAALGGGLTIKLLDLGYQELVRRFERKGSARKFVDENLDPVLKAADEVVGKLRSLSNGDFKPLHGVTTEEIENQDLVGLVYMLAKLWTTLEIFRHEGLSVSITQDIRGKQIFSFMDCIESRRVRIVDRLSQRAVAELLLTNRQGHPEPIPFIEFMKLLRHDTDAQQWLRPVIGILGRTRHRSERQRLLQYGAIIHAMIDTLDPRHVVTRERPSYPNKLTRKSRSNLKYRVFGVYLKFVSNPQKYLGPPKRRPHS